MSELATAAFAAERGEHLVDEPRSRRFDVFRRSFDERAYLRDLAARGFAWIGRSDAAFPQRLRTIHDPPPGLFVRGTPPVLDDNRPAIAVVLPAKRGPSVFASGDQVAPSSDDSSTKSV